MTISLSDFQNAILELQPLVGAQVQKISQSSARELCFQLRVPGQTLCLLIGLEPGQEYLCLTPNRPPALPQPPAFCMALRKYLLNSRWQHIESIPHDRIACIAFRRAGQEYHLLLQCIPRRGQWLLCNPLHTIFLAHPPVQHGPMPGESYPIEGFPASHFPTTSPDINHDLTQHTESLPTPDEPDDSMASVAPNEPTNGLTKLSFPTHDLLYQRHVIAGEAQRLQQQRQILLRQKKAQVKKAQRLLENLQHDWQRCEQTLQHEQEAELLKHNIHNVQKGQSEVEVVDYYDPTLPKRIISLDPTTPPQDYLKKLFHRIKRARRGIDSLLPRIEQVEAEILQYEQDMETLQSIQTRQELLLWFPQQPEVPATHASRSRATAVRLCYREYTALDGKPIWVGRSQQDNDELTLRVAKGHDLWLHVRGWTGSHVILPLQRDESPSSDRLIDAATLAAHFSQAREHTHIDVMYTHVKYVRKPKGAPPGQVTVIQERNISLRRDPERLHRLLQSCTQPS